MIKNYVLILAHYAAVDIVLSDWPHVATDVAKQVAQIVAHHVFQWNRSH